MYPASFDYHVPNTIEEAIGLLTERADAKLLAGGHSLLPAMKLRLATPATLIDMKKLRGSLSYIREEGNVIAIGALTTHAAIAASSVAQQKIPVIAQTASHIGDMQVRNMGTIGGALAHADPAADFPAAILAADAQMVIQSASGKRTVAASDFFQGFFATAVQTGEILVEIRVPVHAHASYEKFYHPASGYAVCGVAVVLEKSGASISKCRIGVTGVAGGAYRASAVESALEGQPYSVASLEKACAGVTEGAEVLEDTFANTAYRSQLARELTRRALIAAWG